MFHLSKIISHFHRLSTHAHGITTSQLCIFWFHCAPHEVHAVREIVDAGLFGAHIVDADLGVGHTAAKARLGVRLALDLPVAAGRTYGEAKWEG